MSKNRPQSAGGNSLGLLKDLKKIQTSLRKDDISWDCWRHLVARMYHMGFLTSQWNDNVTSSSSSSEESSDSDDNEEDDYVLRHV